VHTRANTTRSQYCHQIQSITTIQCNARLARKLVEIEGLEQSFQIYKELESLAQWKQGRRRLKSRPGTASVVALFTRQSIDGITTIRSNLYQDLDSPKSLRDARNVYFFELYARILKSTMQLSSARLQGLPLSIELCNVYLKNTIL
jgi:hypothetical protein